MISSCLHLNFTNLILMQLFFRLINQMQAVFSNSIGCYESDEIGKDLNGGSKIHHLIHEHFPHEIEKIRSSDDDLYQQIKLAIVNIRGEYLFMKFKILIFYFLILSIYI